jgi:hypothetical protein
VILDADLDAIEVMPDIAEDLLLPRTSDRPDELRKRELELKEKGIKPFGEN